MSDPVTNVDIEDVLSSIRRLVTEGGSAGAQRPNPNPDPVVSALRQAATPAQPAPEGAMAEHARPEAVRPEHARPEAVRPESVKPEAVRPEPVKPEPAKPVGRFVLTPAFRVADVPTPAKVPADDLSIAARIMPRAEALRALDGKPPAVGFDFSAPPPARVMPAPVMPPLVTAPPPAEPVDDADDAVPIDGRLRLSETVAGLEAAVTAQPDEWEPDGSEEVPVMDWSQAGPEDGPVFRSRNAAPLRLEQAVAEPAFRHAAPPEVVEETSDPDGLAAFAAVAPPGDAAADDDDLKDFLSGGSVIDEEALRRLIVEIVHQELQGSLGERITRNVRKLVRREISRMIASEEFE